MTPRPSRLGTLILSISLAALLAIAIMIFGARFNLWEPIVGFGYIRNYMNPIGYGVLALGVIGLAIQIKNKNRAGIIKTCIATLIGLGILAPMIASPSKPPKRGPAIHDITTDTNNPPVFLVIDENRSGAKNSLVYTGKKTAAIQKKLYPHIAPIQSNLAPEPAFNKALNVAKDKGWEIVAQDEKTLRFEAIARTPFFAFMDDVVVVVTPLNDASIINIRSISRIGRSDRGVNAARISDFTATFNQ